MAWYETKKGGTARITEKTATGEIATFTTVIGGLPLKSCVVGIQGYQEGTGDPTPVNKRPIITFTGASAVRTGKNLCKEVINDGKVPSITDGTLVTAAGCRTDFIRISPSTTYTVSKATSGAIYVFYYDIDKNYISYQSATGTSYTRESPANAYYIMLRLGGVLADNTNCQLEFGSTATDYTPFTGNDTYSIAWKTEAGEVYSGTINFATGELTSTHGIAEFDGTESYTNTYYPVMVCTKTFPAGTGTGASFISNRIKTDASLCNFANSNKNTFEFRNTNDYYGVSSASELKAKIAQWYSDGSPLQIVYPLAQPVTVQLTPTEIKTVLGENYVWGDCGGNTSIVCYDGNVEHLDDLRDTYDSVNRPDAPTLIAGNTEFNYSALMSTSETIPQNMFNGCTVIQNVESPYVKTVGANAFAGATKLKYISLPNCTQVGAAAFSCQRSVSADKAYVKIDLPKCTTMGTRAFYKFGASDATAELEFPELTQIGSDCFSADGSSTAFTIKSIKLPKLAEAGSTAFQRMTAETIDIGDTCTQLNTTPLAYANVTNFICRATTPPALGSSAGLGGSNMTLTNIYVPDAALSDYTDNTNYPRWAKHAALMHPLSDIEPTT